MKKCIGVFLSALLIAMLLPAAVAAASPLAALAAEPLPVLNTAVGVSPAPTQAASSDGQGAADSHDAALREFIIDHPITVVATLVVLFSLITVALLYTSGKKQSMIEKEKNRQLEEALALARLASASKGNFMSRMSHEIRTPLNAVIGFNTIARNEMTKARTEEERRHADMQIMDCLTKSELASKHLLTIINDVLDMSAIESGKIKVAHERFDFKALVGSLTVLFFAQAKAKGVDFEVVFDTPTEEWFIGDQMRISQILTNLLSNAIKFTFEGGRVRLLIYQKILDDKRASFHFEVADTGIGMTPDELGHIWAPFEQAESTITRRFGGTGLGLTITKSLVDIMGGSINVKSVLGEGSTFTVDITMERTEQPVKHQPFDFSGINALAVDDDVSTCDYIRLLFERCGARCTTVTSGDAAVEMFASSLEKDDRFTVCLVDWRMPRMDGVETVKRIRALAGDGLPIIIVTAYDYSDIARQAEEAGVNMFVSKPLFQSSLFDLLATISGNSAPMSIAKDENINFAGARVLLAEDNKMNMEVARRIFESAGLRVDGVWNGQEAVDIFTSTPVGTYSAILMDVHMPVMDGHKATRAIRASSHPDAKTVPIIAMTADAFAENVAQAYESGMNDHIAKPIDSQMLLMTLKKYISAPAEQKEP